MGLSVFEVKENAEYNLNNAIHPLQIKIGEEQLENYNIAKELGADDNDEWSEWKEKVENYKKKLNKNK